MILKSIQGWAISTLVRVYMILMLLVPVIGYRFSVNMMEYANYVQDKPKQFEKYLIKKYSIVIPKEL